METVAENAVAFGPKTSHSGPTSHSNWLGVSILCVVKSSHIYWENSSFLVLMILRCISPWLQRMGFFQAITDCHCGCEIRNRWWQSVFAAWRNRHWKRHLSNSFSPLLPTFIALEHHEGIRKDLKIKWTPFVTYLVWLGVEGHGIVVLRLKM